MRGRPQRGNGVELIVVFVGLSFVFAGLIIGVVYCGG